MLDLADLCERQTERKIEANIFRYLLFLFYKFLIYSCLIFYKSAFRCFIFAIKKGKEFKKKHKTFSGLFK